MQGSMFHNLVCALSLQRAVTASLADGQLHFPSLVLRSPMKVIRPGTTCAQTVGYVILRKYLMQGGTGMSVRPILHFLKRTLTNLFISFQFETTILVVKCSIILISYCVNTIPNMGRTPMLNILPSKYELFGTIFSLI